MNRNVQVVIQGKAKMVVEGKFITSPLPSMGLRQLSPFLMLDHLGPFDIKPGEEFYIPPHPHKGFEPVTLLFEGALEHKDSAGNHGLLQAGDVQWMTAGKGVIHSEGIQESFRKTGGRMHAIQLWINLPREAKKEAPSYQDIAAAAIPAWEESGIRFRLIAGAYGERKGPAVTYTPLTLITGRFINKKFTDIHVDTSFNAGIFVTKGEMRIDGHRVEAHSLAVTERAGDTLRISGEPGTEFVFMAGAPIDEPMASYGPFVMNNMQEIQDAILEYESGSMGSITF